MSTATAAPAADAAAPKKGKKKLFIIIGVVVLVLALGGGGAVWYLKQKAAAEAAAEEGDDGDAKAGHAKAAHKKDPKALPTFVPLDPFTVNLADRDAERYAQVGVSLELADAHVADQIKAYMPAIRNNVLMVLAHKTSAELLERDGKAKLAHEIQMETAKALGIEIDEEDADAHAGKAGDKDAAADEDKPVKKKKKKKVEQELPVTAVHFSNFIIQ
jgi:flagellar protein FliL